VIALIAALDRNFAIGREGTMPWHLPDDLKRFKQLTLGKTVLMGRKTAVSIGRALPGRTNLVMSRQAGAPYAGQIRVDSIDAALAQAAGVTRWSLAAVRSMPSPCPWPNAYLTWSMPGGIGGYAFPALRCTAMDDFRGSGACRRCQARVGVSLC
jgi:dihydrofolate reductase